MKVNRALLIAALEKCQTESKKEHGLWDQNEWEHMHQCGTSHCIAGWVLRMAGVPLDKDGRLDFPKKFAGMGYSKAADHFLNFSSDISHNLYTACNTIEDLQVIVQKILAEDENNPDVCIKGEDPNSFLEQPE